MATPNGYKDPTKETLLSGRSIADVIGSRGPRGLKGAIVSTAGVDGRPSSFNPHDTKQIVINVDPDGTSGRTLTLSQFTQNSVNAALASAASKISGSDIESVRERTAMAFEELAKMANSGVQKTSAAVAVPPPVPAKHPASAPQVPRKSPPPVQPEMDAETVPETDYAPVETIDRSYSPMAAFGLKKAGGANTRVPAISQQKSNAGPPNKLVYFEKEGIGTVPAFFHDIVVDVSFDDENLTESGFIVLVYDLRFEQAAARWFPPSADPYKRPWAVQINNDRRLYLVHTTGFQYVYDDREFCVLLVEKAVDSEP